MRRKDREMPKEFALMVADKCEYAVLSMVEPSGKPYCVPLSIVRANDIVYFHTAKDGHKIDCLRQCVEVCLACVGDTYRTPHQFTTEYESAIVRGTACEVSDESEKIDALRLLCEHHTPTNMEEFDEAIKRSLSRTAVWKIKINAISGKRKKYDNDGIEMKFWRTKS